MKNFKEISTYISSQSGDFHKGLRCQLVHKLDDKLNLEIKRTRVGGNMIFSMLMSPIRNQIHNELKLDFFK